MYEGRIKLAGMFSMEIIRDYKSIGCFISGITTCTKIVIKIPTMTIDSNCINAKGGSPIFNSL